MAWTKVYTATVAGVAVIVAAGITTITVEELSQSHALKKSDDLWKSMNFSKAPIAESGQHFLRTLGSIELHDATNQVTITISQRDDHKISGSALWTPHGAVGGGGFTKPLTRDGWFIYAEDTSHIWVFTGETLSLVHYTDKEISDESSSEVDKICPKEVREALPESFRKSGRFSP